MLATKTHHAMTDGVGSVDIGHILLDAEPDPGPRTPAKLPQQPSGARSAPHLPGWLPPVITARIARAAIDTALHPGRLIHAGEAAVAMSEVLWQDEVTGARNSMLNVPISTTRRFASVAFDLSEVKEVKRALGGTVNDVVLALATGALRRLLAHRGEELDSPLRAMVPVNLRGDDHESAGNQVTSLFVELPIAATDTRHRYEQTRAAATKLKSGTAALGGQRSYSSPAQRLRYYTSRSRGRCSPQGCSTSRSRTSPARNSGSTHSVPACAESCHSSRYSPTTPSEWRSCPTTATSSSESTPITQPPRTSTCSKPPCTTSSRLCCRSPDPESQTGTGVVALAKWALPTFPLISGRVVYRRAACVLLPSQPPRPLSPISSRPSAPPLTIALLDATSHTARSSWRRLDHAGRCLGRV